MSLRTDAWVSKTDLARYLRCPYAFYLVDRGLVQFEDTVNVHQVQLIGDGVNFQAAIEATIPQRIFEPADLPQVFAQESIQLYGVPVVENAELQIYGQPDAIDTAKGALFPIEVKSHKDVRRSDELELAFYWVLLEPYRTKAAEPRGYLILRRNGIAGQVEVAIKPNRLERVRSLIAEIRHARANGVTPRICTCTLCSGVMRDEIDRATLAKKDLTRIWGIGPAYARTLEEFGISDYEKLLGACTASVVQKLRAKNNSGSSSEVDRWKHHATSYSTSAPVLFGAPLRLNGQFLALDLEYEPGGFIWLVGFCLVGPAGREYTALWAETPADEKANLKRLGEIVRQNPQLPVITWNGKAADIPHLKKAVRRLRLGKALDVVETRHLDLLHHVRASVRFPIPQFGLGDVASYFAIPAVSHIRNGFEALLLYNTYRQSADENQRNEIKTDLLEYNRDDLEALVAVAERIASL